MITTDPACDTAARRSWESAAGSATAVLPAEASRIAPAGRRGLTAKQFEWIASTVIDHCGIHLPPSRLQSVEGRLGPRLRALGLADMTTYLAYLKTAEGRKQEFVHFIDAITINKTEFFREAGHYNLLTERVLPELSANLNVGTRYPLRLWSAGCSSGEEPYTLAMVLKEYALRHPPFQFSILATDLSRRVLERATRAVYPLESFAPIPEPLRKKYLLRNRDPEREDGRIAPEIREAVEFRPLNLMDPEPRTGGPLDIIFCRNVMIYFTKTIREALIRRLIGNLRVGGHLFVGHAETLTTMALPIATVGPTVFRRVS